MKAAINFWPVIVSAIVSTGLGFLWFMVMFRQPYIDGLGRTKAQLDQGPSGPVASVMQLVGNIVMIYILAWLMSSTDHQSVTQGMKLALVVWIGFIAAVTGPMYAFEAFSFQFFMITTGYTLVCLLLSGAILGAWK